LPVWRNVIKHLLQALIPIAILPGFLLGSMIVFFGMTLETVLITVMLAELYLVWIQAEVSMRQIKLSEWAYEPVLLAELSRITDPSTNIAILRITLKNIGGYPAYDVFTNIYAPHFVPLEETFRIVGTIEARAEEAIYTLDEVTFKRYPYFDVEVSYYNQLGRPGGLTFTFHWKFMPHPLAIPGRKEMPGVLLNSIEDLRRISGLFTMDRKIKKLKDRMKQAQ